MSYPRICINWLRGVPFQSRGLVRLRGDRPLPSRKLLRPLHGHKAVHGVEIDAPAIGVGVHHCSPRCLPPIRRACGLAHRRRRSRVHQANPSSPTTSGAAGKPGGSRSSSRLRYTWQGHSRRDGCKLTRYPSTCEAMCERLRGRLTTNAADTAPTTPRGGGTVSVIQRFGGVKRKKTRSQLV